MGDFHSPMQIKRRPSVSDRPHHPTCVGAAKAEAVVQYGLHLPLFGYMGTEIHASARLARRTEARRVGQESVSTCRSRWSQVPYQQTTPCAPCRSHTAPDATA